MMRIALSLAAGLLLTACSEPAATETPDAAPETAATAEAPPGPAVSPSTGSVREVLLRENPGADDLRYAFAPVDLNGDGQSEMLAYVVGPTVCGSGGCSLYVLSGGSEGWSVLARTSVTQTPIGVLDTSTGGWRDLAVSVGGGGAPAGWVRLAWDGQSYPSNPTTVAPGGFDETAITTLLASDPPFVPLA